MTKSGLLLSKIMFCFMLSGCAPLTQEEQRLLTFRPNNDRPSSQEDVISSWEYNKERTTKVEPDGSTRTYGVRVSYTASLVNDSDQMEEVDLPTHAQFQYSQYYPTIFSKELENQSSCKILYNAYLKNDELVSTHKKYNVLGKMEIEWSRKLQKETVGFKMRSPLHVITYPVWGLPLDVLDAPFTFSRWLGFTDNLELFLADKDPAGGILAVGGGLLGVAIGAGTILYFVSPAAVAIPLAIVVGGTLGVMGLFGGTIIANDVFDFHREVCQKFQVPVLRSGIDSEDYFPMWKFRANEPYLKLSEKPSEWAPASIQILDDANEL